MEEIVNDTVIEGSLKLRGWVVSSEAPLVLGVQLTHHISCVFRDEKGVEGRYQSLRLRRAGERYAVGVGYNHLLTVNLQTSTIYFWRKGKSE